MPRKGRPQFRDALGEPIRQDDFVVVIGQSIPPRPGLVREIGYRESDSHWNDGDPYAVILLAWRAGPTYDRAELPVPLQRGEWSTLDTNGQVTYPLYIKTFAEHNVVKVSHNSLPRDVVLVLEENANVELRRVRAS